MSECYAALLDEEPALDDFDFESEDDEDDDELEADDDDEDGSDDEVDVGGFDAGELLDEEPRLSLR